MNLPNAETQKITKNEAIKLIASIFDVALTSESLKDRVDEHKKRINLLGKGKIHSTLLTLAESDDFNVRGIIRWSDADIQIRIYLGDEVVKDQYCDYDQSIIKSAFDAVKGV